MPFQLNRTLRLLRPAAHPARRLRVRRRCRVQTQPSSLHAPPTRLPHLSMQSPRTTHPLTAGGARPSPTFAPHSVPAYLPYTAV